MEVFPVFTGEYLFDSCSPVQMLLTHQTVTSVRHQHDFVELAYVVQGKGIHLAGEDKMQVMQGDMLVIPPGVSHVFHPQDLSGAEPLLILNCMLRPELGRMLSELAGPFSEEDHLPLLKLLEVKQWFGYREKNKELSFLLRRMQGMQNNNTLQDQQQLYPLLRQLAKLIMPAAAVPFVQRPGLDYDPLHDVILYMITNYSEKITLNEMSSQIAVSSRQFQRLLKNKTGRSYIQILQEIRMKYSCILLLFTELGVQSIALEVGIYDMKYFYRLFREYSGMTPACYRNRLHHHYVSAKEMMSSVEHCSR
ncbi:helix-turn-helix domain-containing protein [Paenibacillus tritici]|uniref:AraC family transcriptional regulator n=1 Tax=Paenibacillus tritici TaxID=1873425 RepID=UPI001BAD20BD|nr:AraC family transcriptional regulator [Paenibacillus tritici]QUL53166.1 helix-turn-helix domain-containing protein [Paenibacillus tritici]